MLNRAKVMQALQIVHHKLFYDNTAELSLARTIWHDIVSNQDFSAKVQASCWQLGLPTWQGAINQTVSIPDGTKEYTVVCTDGSQIYPDRHQGTSCFLINIGQVQITYGAHGGVFLDSQPYVFVDDDDEFDISTDLVDCRRQELELQAGLSLCKKIQECIFLVDGSLIFWHLSSKEPQVRDYFMLRYIQALDEFYQRGIPIAGYISMPKSKELVNLLRFAEDVQLDHCVDTSIARFFLKPRERTVPFANHSPIARQYPDHVKPYFFYVDFGYEMARVEIPAWIAHNQTILDTVACRIYDQVLKGYGYPIAIAEAHEQAVVKGPDRDFFYHLIQKLSIESSRNISISQKSSKKRKMPL